MIMSDYLGSVYLVGPITGTVYGESESWRDHVVKELEKVNVAAYSPMRGKDRFFDRDDSFDVISYDQHPMISGHGISIRDFADVKRCDLILANFKDSDRVSIGSCLEIGAAINGSKPIVVVMEEDNLHYHDLITENAIVVPTIEEAIYYIKHYFVPNLD